MRELIAVEALEAISIARRPIAVTHDDAAEADA